MLSLPLLKRTIQSYRRLWLLFTLLLTGLLLLGMGMYGTRFATAIQYAPQALLAIFDMKWDGSDLTEYVSAYLYGFCFLILPMIYEVTAAKRLLAQEVEEGSMTYLVATPVGRKCIANTKAYFLILSLGAMFLCTGAAGILCGFLWLPGELVISQFVLLNLGAFCLHICISGISFLASSLCDDTRTMLMIGGGVPVLFYLIHIIANLGGNLRILRFATIFTLFDRGGIMDGNLSVCITLPVLALVGLGLYQAGVQLFDKRDLPL